MKPSLSRAAAAAALLLTAAPAAPQGPVWCETLDGLGDAGSLPSSAQKPGPPGAPLGKIMGALTGLAPVGGDFEDMYLIYIVDPFAFFASTDFADGGGAAFNTQLFLFRVDPLDCNRAFGLLGNDDVTPIQNLSRIDPVSTDGSGAQLLSPGFYYLAISGGPFNDPLSAGGPIFDQIVPTEISGPDGPGGADPILGWNGGDPANVGPYEIVFPEGTVELPGPCCPGDLDRDGQVTFADLLIALSSWGRCFGCTADLDGDGFVGFQDMLPVLAGWGPCGDDA